MAVTWDATDVQDYEALHADKIEWAKTEYLLISNWGYGLMDKVGLGSITEKNYAEFYNRLAVLQGLFGSFFTWSTDGSVANSTDVMYTLNDIKRRIGLRSNYSNKTRAAFMKDLGKLMDMVAQDHKQD